MKAIFNKIKLLLNNRFVSDTITTTLWSNIGRGMGFLVPFFIAYWFGISGETDVFFFAYGVILFVSGVFAPVVEGLLIPYIVEIDIAKRNSVQFVNHLITKSAIWIAIFSVFFVCTVPFALRLAAKFTPSSLKLLTILLLEITPLLLLLSWTSILSGFFNAKKLFIFPALSPAIRAIVNLIVICALKNRIGIHSVAIGYVLGETVRFLVLFIAAKMNNYHIRLTLAHEPLITQFMGKMAYQSVSMAVVGFLPIINKFFASWLQQGSISILEYADRVYIIPITFLSSGLMVTLLSHFSDKYYEYGKKKLVTLVNKAAVGTAILTIPLTLILMALSGKIAYLIYGHGAFDLSKINDVGVVLFFNFMGLTPYMLGIIFVRAHLAIKNTPILMNGALLNIIANCCFVAILIRFLGIRGIAISVFLVSVINAIFLAYNFYKIVNTYE